MVISKSRNITLDDVWLVFVTVLLPVQVWAIVWILYDVPSLLMRLDSLWDVIGVIAYTQAYALLEALALVLFVTLLGLAMPRRLVQNKFAALGCAFLLISSLWAELAQAKGMIVLRFGTTELIVWFVIYLISILTPWFLILRSDKAALLVVSVARRIAVLAALYLFIDVLSVLVVIIRNL